MSAQDHLSAQQFVRHVRETGGATMNVRSGKLQSPGRPGYIVGGEPDSSGQRIPTSFVPLSEFSEKHVEAHAQSLRSQTRDSRVNLGAWVNGDHVELDASRTTPRRNEAVRKGRNRGELEVWDNRHMRGIKTSDQRGGGR